MQIYYLSNLIFPIFHGKADLWQKTAQRLMLHPRLAILNFRLCSEGWGGNQGGERMINLQSFLGYSFLQYVKAFLLSRTCANFDFGAYCCILSQCFLNDNTLSYYMLSCQISLSYYSILQYPKYSEKEKKKNQNVNIITCLHLFFKKENIKITPTSLRWSLQMVAFQMYNFLYYVDELQKAGIFV